jgi:uncharacterized membrane protein YagU involved in acid resistance
MIIKNRFSVILIILIYVTLVTGILRSVLIVKLAYIPPRRPEFDLKVGYVGFVVDKVAMVEASSEYLDFPSNSHSIEGSILIYHSGLVQ